MDGMHFTGLNAASEKGDLVMCTVIVLPVRKRKIIVSVTIIVSQFINAI